MLPGSRLVIVAEGLDARIGEVVYATCYRTRLRARRVVQFALWAVLVAAIPAFVVGLLIGDSFGAGCCVGYALVVWWTGRRFAALAWSEEGDQPTMTWLIVCHGIIGRRLIQSKFCLFVLAVTAVFFGIGSRFVLGPSAITTTLLEVVALYGITIVDLDPPAKRHLVARAKARLKALIPRVNVRIPVPA